MNLDELYLEFLSGLSTGSTPVDSSTDDIIFSSEHQSATLIEKIALSSNFFEVLGFVTPLTGNLIEKRCVRLRFREYAILVHPDKTVSKGATEAFQRILEAFEVLYNEDTQALYLEKLNSEKTPVKGAYRKKRKRESKLKSWIEVEFELMRREKEEAVLREKFISKNADLYQRKKLERLLKKCESICREMDERVGKEDDLRFWSQNFAQKPDMKMPELTNMDLQNNILARLSYLRSHYFYCVFCSKAYNDNLDLEENCPSNATSLIDGHD